MHFFSECAPVSVCSSGSMSESGHVPAWPMHLGAPPLHLSIIIYYIPDMYCEGPTYRSLPSFLPPSDISALCSIMNVPLQTQGSQATTSVLSVINRELSSPQLYNSLKKVGNSPSLTTTLCPAKQMGISKYFYQ